MQLCYPKMETMEYKRFPQMTRFGKESAITIRALGINQILDGI